MHVPKLSQVTVEIVVDNFIDVFEVSRPGKVERATVGRLKKPLLAAHGLSYVITLTGNGKTTRLLMDTANTPTALFHNLEALEINPDDFDALFLSHGHPDHYGGLMEMLRRRTRPLPVYLHPDSYFPKLLITPKGRVGPWSLEKDQVMSAGAMIVENTGPVLIADQALLTGTIEAVTDYETPLPGPKRIVGGTEERDSFSDEQALVAQVEGQGLVVVSACSHPGIVNIVKYAQKLTGVDEVAAVVGGFHLTAGGDALIKNTIEGLHQINPGLIVAGHCTGFRALTRLAAAFPENFMVSCVGTRVMVG